MRVVRKCFGLPSHQDDPEPLVAWGEHFRRFCFPPPPVDLTRRYVLCAIVMPLPLQTEDYRGHQRKKTQDGADYSTDFGAGV